MKPISTIIATVPALLLTVAVGGMCSGGRYWVRMPFGSLAIFDTSDWKIAVRILYNPSNTLLLTSCPAPLEVPIWVKDSGARWHPNGFKRTDLLGVFATYGRFDTSHPSIVFPTIGRVSPPSSTYQDLTISAVVVGCHARVLMVGGIVLVAYIWNRKVRKKTCGFAVVRTEQV